MSRESWFFCLQLLSLRLGGCNMRAVPGLTTPAFARRPPSRSQLWLPCPPAVHYIKDPKVSVKVDAKSFFILGEVDKPGPNTLASTP